MSRVEEVPVKGVKMFTHLKSLPDAVELQFGYCSSTIMLHANNLKTV